MAIFGDTLRQARAYKGVTLKEAEQATRINRHHLAALEDENFVGLPPLIYQRGIVRNYATYLDLDPGKLLSMFEEAHGASAETAVVPTMKPLDMPNHWAPNFAVIAFMVVMAAVVFAWLYSAYFARTEALPTVTQSVPTVTPPVPTPVARSDVRLPSIPAATPKATRPAASKTPTSAAGDAAGNAAATDGATATAEATQTPKPKPTQRPKPSATAKPSPTEVPPTEAVPTEPPAAATSVPAVATDVPPTQPTGDQFAITVQATGKDGAAKDAGGISLTVVGDDQVLWQGFLNVGDSTPSLRATKFSVTTSDVNDTLVTPNGDPAKVFYMPGDGEVTFPLP